MITDAMKAAVPPGAVRMRVPKVCAELVSHYPEDLFWWHGEMDAKAGFYCDDLH